MWLAQWCMASTIADATEDDPILEHNVKKGEAQWVNVKEILGTMFDGELKFIWLLSDKQDALIQTLCE